MDVQFASSKLTAAMRGSLSGCKVDVDTLVYSAEPRKQIVAGEECISKYEKASISIARRKEKEERYSTYLQQRQTSYSAAQPQPVLAGGAPC
jgi:hypothetical protein